jgi:hypothetical protein
LIIGFNTFLLDGCKISLADLERQEAERQAQQCDVGVEPFVDRSQPILQQLGGTTLPFSFGKVSSGGKLAPTPFLPPIAATVPFSFGGVSSGGSESSTRADTFIELSGEGSVLATGHTLSKHKTVSGQAFEINVDEIGTAMDKHGHNEKASKVFPADSPEHSDQLEKLARLHIPRRDWSFKTY